MTLKSMTGFARVDGSSSDAAWTIEIRSLNGRGLDLQVRLPVSLDAIDTEIRNSLKRQLARGKINLTVNVKREKSATKLELNESAFSDLLRAANRAGELAKLPLTDISVLLSHKQIFDEIEGETSPEQEQQLQGEILADVNKAINVLTTARKEEGASLTNAIKQRLEKIEELTKAADQCPDRSTQAISERLKANIENLLGQTDSLSEDRLHQEAILIAIKADIAEELDRLNSHIAQANALLTSDEPIGRQFDILCQEFNREANTICSKSASQSLTYIGLELKTLIDQLREQVQNIE